MKKIKTAVCGVIEIIGALKILVVRAFDLIETIAMKLFLFLVVEIALDLSLDLFKIMTKSLELSFAIGLSS